MNKGGSGTYNVFITQEITGHFEGVKKTYKKGSVHPLPETIAYVFVMNKWGRIQDNDWKKESDDDIPNHQNT